MIIISQSIYCVTYIRDAQRIPFIMPYQLL